MSADLFETMTSLDNLFACWYAFKRGKRQQKEIQHFERFLEDNIFRLREDLNALVYKHGSYQQFRVCDPKERLLSKASVRDRFVHHIVYEMLTKIFDSKLIFHFFSCRKKKGVHKGTLCLQKMIRKASQNGSKNCWALKIDIRRFFDTINHGILKKFIRKHVFDEKLLHLIHQIIDSFHQSTDVFGPAGLPLGNVSSQLFANIYLHELIDFVGYVHFLHHRILRPQTKRRLRQGFEHFQNGALSQPQMDQKIQSYLGLLSHANEFYFSEAIKNTYWVR